MIREMRSGISAALRRKLSSVFPRPLKYQGAAVVFQEVPDEISLAINIAGCTRNCKGCHSPHLREYEGALLRNNITDLIMQNSGITCVCFMGGDQNLRELRRITRMIRRKWPGLKICLYTGEDDEEKRRALCEAYGITYVFRRGELKRIADKKEAERITLKLPFAAED